MAALLNEIPGIVCTPSAGAFYLYVSVHGLIGKQTNTGKFLESDLDVVMFFLSKAGVAVLDGAVALLALSFASSLEAIEEGCDRLKKAVATLR